MKKLTIILAILFFFQGCLSLSQELSSHKWKNRVLLLLTDNLTNKQFIQQLQLLNSDTDGLEERKLKVYQSTPTDFLLGLNEGEWIKSGKLYNDFKLSDSPFEAILIGLDGGVKLRKTELLQLDESFGTIDAMPMRMNEIRNDN